MSGKDAIHIIPPPEYSEHAEGSSGYHDTLHFPQDSKDTPNDPGGPPPSYTSPTSYKIGSQRLLDPLINIQQLKAHLTLLREFKKLKRAVQETSAEELKLTDVAKKLSPDKRWAWVVGMAVERCVTIP